MHLENKKLKPTEIEINISTLIEQCFYKIKLISIVGLIFGVLLCGLVYLGDLKQYNRAINIQNNNNAIEVDSDTYAIQNYILLKNKVKQVEEYKENSLYLQMSFNNVSQGKVVFYVDAQEDIRTDIVNSIKNYINGGLLASKLSKRENFPKEQYIQELILAEVPISGEQSSIGLFTLQVLGVDTQQNKVFTSAVIELIKEYSNSIKDALADHSLMIVSEDYISTYVGNVYTIQRNFLQEYETLKAELQTHIATMSQDELFFANSISVDSNTSINELVEEIIANKPTFNFKYAFLGFIGGIFVTVGIICVKALFSGKIQTEKELLYRFNISHLGTICNNKYLNKLLYRNNSCVKEQKQLILSKLKMKMQPITNEKVVFTSVTTIADCKEVNELINELKNKKIEGVIVENALENVALLETLDDSVNIVLVETIAESDIKKLYEVMMLWAELKANVLGYIVVKR